MLEPAALFAFSLTALLFAASPGPNFIFVLTRSVGYGRTEGLASSLGICTGTTYLVLGASVAVGGRRA